MKNQIRDLLEEAMSVDSEGHLVTEPDRPKNTATKKPRKEKKVTEQDVMDFVAKCQELVDNHMKKNYPKLQKEKLSYAMGRRYAKITKEHAGVFAFIDLENGDVLKPASWNAPAKHARGNLFDAHGGMKYIGPYGPAYLYR